MYSKISLLLLLLSAEIGRTKSLFEPPEYPLLLKSFSSEVSIIGEVYMFPEVHDLVVLMKVSKLYTDILVDLRDLICIGYYIQMSIFSD